MVMFLFNLVDIDLGIVAFHARVRNYSVYIDTLVQSDVTYA